jgi:flagellar motor switch protein FliM
MEHLSGQTWIDATKSRTDQEVRGTLEASLQAVEANVTAILATAKIPMREFLKVKVNDVIVAETRVSEPTRILVSGVEKFRARPGIQGRFRAFEIVSVTTDGESR